MNKYIDLEFVADGVALITLAHPGINNHCSWQVVDQLAKALIHAREQGARVSVLASDVPGHWFEHAWLADLYRVAQGEPPLSDPDASGINWFTVLEELNKTPVITIAAISGNCSGGGAEIGWACDLRVAEEQVSFSQPEVKLNLTPGVGGVSRLARLVGRTMAAEMVLDGTPQSTDRIFQMGGINKLVAKGEATGMAVDWAKRIAEKSPLAVAAIKRILIDNDESTLSEALVKEQQHFQSVVKTEQAIKKMQEVQGRFEQGESIESVYADA